MRNEKGQFVKGLVPHNKQDDVDHGHHLMYNRGCRCDLCKAAWTHHVREQKGSVPWALQKLQPCKDCNERPRFKGRRCKECMNELARVAENKKNRRLSELEYSEMFVAQNGTCLICKKPETSKRNGKIKELAEDHCHKTNTVRGLLCANHNTGLGLFNDDPALLEAAAQYLRERDKK